MAIKLNFIWRGVTIPQAYVRIDHIQGGKREERVTPSMSGTAVWQASVGVYADSGQNVPILVLGISVPITDINESPFIPLYAALKAMPDFAGAVDC